MHVLREDEMCRYVAVNGQLHDDARIELNSPTTQSCEI
jgi:hypothetical protein